MRKLFEPIDPMAEGEEFIGDIKVGTGMTELLWSDRLPYEVVAVRDQKHITVRRLDYEKAPGAESYSNDWLLFSDDSLPTKDMFKIGDLWFWTWKDNGRVHQSKANVMFGEARYYYDYSF